MPRSPANPKIYHITHVRNLPKIVDAGVLWSDAKRIELRLDCEIVGMSRIKQRRLQQIALPCHPGTTVGDYVPFYFCPRSIMLYILHRGNHPDVTYTQGQGPIVHLQADLMATVRWADQNHVRWAFSDRNAGGSLAGFFNSLDDLDKVNWPAVAATDFRDMMVKEGKQAEFLVHESFPWRLVERIGVHHATTVNPARQALAATAHQPAVTIEPDWYY